MTPVIRFGLSLLAVAVLVGAAPPPRSVGLRLTDGRPVADARIVFLERTYGGPEVRGETTTDATGRFASISPQAGYALLLGGPEWPPVFWRMQDALPVVRAAGRRRVRVVAAAGGRPIEGAGVVAVPKEMPELLSGFWPGTSAATDRNGEARVPFDKASDVILVRAKGFATKLMDGSGTVALEHAVVLEGRLLDSAGRPRTGKVVLAAASPRQRIGQGVILARARTNERGVFRFDDVPEVVRLLHEDEGAAPAWTERRALSDSPDLVALDAARIRTRLVDALGNPVSGVELQVEQFAANEAVSIRRTATSGSDGIAVAAPLSPALERTRIVVRTPWRTFDSKVFTEPLGTLKDLGDWKLAPAAPVTGAVVDASGRPVPKATLTWPRTGETLATTDTEGKFSASLMEGQSVYVTVSARGFVDEEVWIRTGSSAKVHLRRACVLKAKPRLPDGSAPREVFAIATTERGQVSPEAMKARADGTFVLEGEDFSARMALRIDGFEDADLGFVSLSEGESRDFGVVDLFEGPSIRGELVDAGSGEALVGARVTAQPVREGDLIDTYEDARVPTATTGADGTFRVGGLPEGDIRLWVEAPGHAVSRFDVEALAEGNDLGRLEVPRGEPLEVLVEYPDGTPAPGIPVVVRPGGFDGYLKEQTFTTGPEGRFVIPRIAPGRHALRATAGVRYVRRLVTVDAERSFTFRLTGARVEGRVTADGEPFPGVRVTLWYGGPGLGTVIDDPKTRDGIPLERRVVGEPPLAPPSSTDNQGRFVFPEAGEGKASLRIEGSGWGAESREIEVPSSGRLWFEIALGAVELTARLVDETGIPVAPGQLGVFGDGAFRLAASSVDAEGRAVFYLEGSGKARYLRGTDNGERKGFRLLVPKDLTSGKDVDLVLGGGTASLAVEAMDADRRPSPAASLHLVNLSDRTVVTGRCDAEGRWQRSNLPEGRYRVVARGKEGGVGEAEITVPERGEASLAVRMEEAGKLALRIEASPDVDPTTLRVKVLDSRGRDRAAEEEVFGRSAAPNDRGRYALPALPPGRYRVEVSGKDVATESASVDVTASRTTTRAIRVR